MSTVILLHGIWMRSFSLLALRRRMSEAGFAVESYDYASVRGGVEKSADTLRARILRDSDEQVHLVGHSLGGLVALRAVASLEVARGRVVCLGSPLNGSSAARSLARIPGGAALMGNSYAPLVQGLQNWKGPTEVGVVAGRVPIGVGLIVGGLIPPHDGTVSIDETHLPGLTDHCVIAATHTGLLFSEEAAAQAIAFINSGRFVKPT